MMRFKKKEKEAPHIELTSLIDVIFILLIFIILSSTFLRPVIKVKLPVASTEEKEKRKKFLVLLSNDNRLFVNRKEISINNLQYFVEKEMDKNPNFVALVNCDKNVVYEKFIAVIDILKNAGVKNVAISHKAKKK